MSKVAMDFLISKLDCRGIVAEVAEEDSIQIKYLTVAERRRVMAALLGLEVDELLPGRIYINHEIQVQLVAKFIIDKAELAENRRKKVWCD